MSQAQPITSSQMSPEEAVRRVAHARELLLKEVHKVIIGQDEMIEQMIICIFARGHCLTIGVPGLAKTLDRLHTGQGHASEIQSDSVHTRPDAQRHHGNRDH